MWINELNGLNECLHLFQVMHSMASWNFQVFIHSPLKEVRSENNNNNDDDNNNNNNNNNSNNNNNNNNNSDNNDNKNNNNNNNKAQNKMFAN